MVVTCTDAGRTLTKVSAAWTSSAGGEVSGNPFDLKQGYIHRIEIVPTYYVTPPTTLYDVYVRDEDGVDLLAGAGVDQSITVGEIVNFSPALYFPGGTVDVQVFAAGDSKTGRVDIVIL